MKFRGEIIVDNTGEIPAEMGFVMVEKQPERMRPEIRSKISSSSSRLTRVRRLMNLFKPDKDRQTKPGNMEPPTPFECGKIDGEQFQVVNAPEKQDPWKLFRD